MNSGRPFPDLSVHLESPRRALFQFFPLIWKSRGGPLRGGVRPSSRRSAPATPRSEGFDGAPHGERWEISPPLPLGESHGESRDDFRMRQHWSAASAVFTAAS